MPRPNHRHWGVAQQVQNTPRGEATAPDSDDMEYGKAPNIGRPGRWFFHRLQAFLYRLFNPKVIQKGLNADLLDGCHKDDITALIVTDHGGLSGLGDDDHAQYVLLAGRADDKIIMQDSATIPPLNMTERSSEPSDPADGDIYLDDGTNTASGSPGFRRYDSGGGAWEDISAISGGSGDVVGPASATDNALTRFDSTTGKLIQDSGVSLSDLNVDKYTIKPTTITGVYDIEIKGSEPTVGGDGGQALIYGGDGQSANNNGGNVNIDGGAPAGSGTGGSINIGTSNAEAVSIGRSGKTTTIDGTVEAEGLKHVYFQGRNASAQTGVTTATRLQIDTQMHNSHTGTYSLDTTTNIGRLTINTTGTYRVTCDFEFESNDTTRSEFIGMLYKNGTLLTGAQVHTYHRTTAQDETGATINYIVDMTAGDYLEMFFDDRNGGANTVADRNRLIVERLA